MANPDAAASSGPSRAEIPALIEKQKESGKSIAAFAREHGIPPWKLYQAGRPRKPRKAPAPKFIEVKAPRGAPDLELVIRETTRLRIPADFDEVTLRRLLGVLSSC